VLNLEAVGVKSSPTPYSWTSKDTLLYAVGVGAGQNPVDEAELQFVTENSEGIQQRVLPTYASLPGLAGILEAREAIGPYERSKLVLGEVEVTVHKPLPADGSVINVIEVEAIYDKGRGALVVYHGEARDAETGEPMIETRQSHYIRDYGGWGGDRGLSRESEPPARAPDHEVVHNVRPEQALIYRLSGDRNRLHSDPWYAQKAGFQRPILHGLCTFGFAGRAVLQALCDSDVERFVSMSGRMSSPVYTGTPLTTRIWVTEPGKAVFRVINAEGATSIDLGECTYRP
jgi:acyl dehydratase